MRVQPLELLPEQDPLIEAAKKVAKPRPHWPQGYSRNLDHCLYGVPKRVRQDKNWSVTDCTSFVVMREHNLTEALTADRHFEQAGFKAILV